MRHLTVLFPKTIDHLDSYLMSSSVKDLTCKANYFDRKNKFSPYIPGYVLSVSLKWLSPSMCRTTLNPLNHLELFLMASKIFCKLIVKLSFIGRTFRLIRNRLVSSLHLHVWRRINLPDRPGGALSAYAKHLYLVFQLFFAEMEHCSYGRGSGSCETIANASYRANEKKCFTFFAILHFRFAAITTLVHKVATFSTYLLNDLLDMHVQP